MTTPANLTYSDVQTRVANWLRIPTSNTTEMTKIQALINAVYRDLAAKQDWWWLLKRSVINTTPRILDSAASLTLNSAVGTLSSAPKQNAVNVSVAGFVMLVPGGSQDSGAVYRVTSTHAAGTTAFALDAAFTNATSTATSINLYQDSLSLPTDCGKVVQVKRYGERRPLVRAGLEEFSRFKIGDTREGRPEVYTVIDFDTTGDPTTARKLQVHPYPDTNYHRLEVFYKQNLNTEVSGTTRFFIPDDYIQVLEYGALARGYPIFLNDLERGKYYQSLFNDVLALMAAQQREYASDHAQMAPDNIYRSRVRRRRASNTTLGSLFDRLPADR